MAFTPGILNYPPTLDSVVSLFETSDNATTTLNGDINTIVTTITVGSTSLFPTTGSITIESEIIYYTGKTSTTFTGCIRGSAGTSAASHLTGVSINGRHLAEHHNILALAIVAIETKIGTGTTIDAVQIGSGAVNNTEFAFLDGVSSAIQTQLDNKTSPPFSDATNIIKGNADATKLLRFDISGFTTSTTRVITPPDADTKISIASQTITFTGPTAPRTITLPDAAFTAARIDAAQAFSGTQAFAGLTASGTIVQTSASAAAFESGRQGSTDPTFRLISNTTNAVTGIQITGRASGQGALLEAISGATNERLFIRSKGNGVISLGPGSGSTDTYWTFNTNTGSYTQSSGTQMGWTSSGADSSNTPDAGFNRNATAVVEANNGTAGQWGAFKCGVRDAGTNTNVVGLTLGHQTTGTQSSNTANLGISILFNINSKTVPDSNAAKISTLWTDATEASATSDIVFYTRTGGGALVEAFRLTGGLQAIHAGIPRFNGTNSTGAGTALLGANCPAVTLTAPYTWLTVITSDGSTGYIPVFK